MGAAQPGNGGDSLAESIPEWQQSGEYSPAAGEYNDENQWTGY